MDATREKCAAASRRVLKLGIVSFRGKMPDPRSTCQKAPAGPRPPSKGDGRSVLPAQSVEQSRKDWSNDDQDNRGQHGEVAHSASARSRPIRSSMSADGSSRRRSNAADPLRAPQEPAGCRARGSAGLVLKALTLAIEFISTLPENSQLSSDVEDTREILRLMLPKDEDLVTYQKSVQWMVHGTLPE